MANMMTSDLKTSPMAIGVAAGGTSMNAGERRRYERYPFTATLEAFEPESETRIQGRTADLSEGGCYVDTISPLATKTRLKVRITRGQRSFESPAVVVYSVLGMGMGLEFEATDSQQMVNLKKWVGELSGEATAEAEIEEKSAPVNTEAASVSVLKELVTELMRKGVLAEGKGRGMLKRLADAGLPPSTQ